MAGRANNLDIKESVEAWHTFNPNPRDQSSVFGQQRHMLALSAASQLAACNSALHRVEPASKQKLNSCLGHDEDTKLHCELAASAAAS